MLIRAPLDEINKEFEKKIDLTILNAGECYADPTTENVTSTTSVAVNLK